MVWLIGAVVCLLAAPRIQLFTGVGGQWMAAQCAAVSLAHVNQLPLSTLQSASGHESDSCKQRYSKHLT